jgi:quercetin dioxygenase-like cupin family protein
VIHHSLRRELNRAELRELVTGLAANPKLWGHLVHHDPEARVYEELLRDDHVAVWLICWMHDHDTGFHDHDTSAGALTVARGRIREERLGISGTAIERELDPGESIDFAAADIHRVTHAGDGPAVTINAYSPPLWRMGAYEVKPTGELQRHSISYAEELRPIDGDRAVA